MTRSNTYISVERRTESLPRANVLGVGIHAIDMARAVAQSEQLLANGGKGYVCVTGVHGVMESRSGSSCSNSASYEVKHGCNVGTGTHPCGAPERCAPV